MARDCGIDVEGNGTWLIARSHFLLSSICWAS
jgi:hypothetical protein